MKKLTFWSIIEKTLETANEPLSPKEIWEKANSYKITEGFVSVGKTPWATIAAYIYTDINRGGSSSLFIQTSERPAQFFLRSKINQIDIQKVAEKKETEIINKEANIAKQFHERDLHTLLVAFANSHTHFKAYLKTIFHEQSSKGTKGLNEWLHPDLVGVYFPFKDYKSEILEIQNHLSISTIKIGNYILV
ncbi:HTH domain-containing protein [Ferruginibacter sp.]